MSKGVKKKGLIAGHICNTMSKTKPGIYHSLKKSNLNHKFKNKAYYKEGILC